MSRTRSWLLTSAALVAVAALLWTIRERSSSDPAPTGSPTPVPCAGTDRLDCLYEELDTTLAAAGPAAALDRLTELQDLDEDIRASCHVLTHHVGQQSAAAGADLEELLALDDGQCQWGYQHGVLEGWALRTGETELAAWLPGACDTYPHGSRDRDSCGHSLGHAIAMQGPETISTAIARCELAAEIDRVGCVGGVLMSYSTGEASQGGASPRRPLRLTREEVGGLCTRLAEAYRQECAAKTWMFTKQVGMGIEDGAAMCPAGHRDACWRGFGARLFYETGVNGVEALHRCAATTFPDPCALGVVQAAAGAWVGTDRPREAYPGLCRNLRPALREDCERTEQTGLTFSAATDSLAGSAP